MAKIIEFTDNRGVDYPTSYWRLKQFEADIDNKHAIFRFVGYKDQESRTENKAIVGQIAFVVDADEFDYYYQLHMVNGLNLAQVAYTIANDQPKKLDVDGVPRPFFFGGEDAI
jgi:hypothetical protein